MLAASSSPAVGLFVLAGATPAALGLLADVSERFPADRGAIMGLYSVFLAIGQIIGSLIGGFAADWRGIDGMLIATVGLLASRSSRSRGCGPRSTRSTAGNVPPASRGSADCLNAILGLVSSNVGQSYPYTSETEAERAAASRPSSPRTRIWRQARRRDDSARCARALVGLEVPDPGLSGPPPRGRLRARPPRGLRRLRRDLRQDVPALTDTRRGQASRRRLLADSAGIAVSAIGFGFVFGLSAREAGFSPVEAMAMSTIVFAGAVQFAAVGYVASGLAWPGIVLLTALLNARHLLYSAALGPWLRDVPLPGGR